MKFTLTIQHLERFYGFILGVVFSIVVFWLLSLFL